MTTMLLFPGSGSSSTHASLVAIEQAVAPMRCVRADFPYRKEGRKVPDRAPVLLEAVRAEAAALASEPLILGGRSMGGRICSLAVADAEAPVQAVGLVLISYPLHPPGKPEKLRVEHFPRLHVPCLFISGTKDTFGTRKELLHWTSTLDCEVTHRWFEGKGHDLKKCDQEIADVVADWVAGIA